VRQEVQCSATGAPLYFSPTYQSLNSWYRSVEIVAILARGHGHRSAKIPSCSYCPLCDNTVKLRLNKRNNILYECIMKLKRSCVLYMN
jgi:hypothetical protein